MKLVCKRIGDFYEFFDESAIKVADITMRDYFKTNGQWNIGIPYHQIYALMAAAKAHGHEVEIQE